MFVDISLRFITRDFRVDFFKARAIARFRNQFARSQKTIGSHLNNIYTLLDEIAKRKKITSYNSALFLSKF